MALFLDQEKFIEDNVLKYDERINSKVAQFIDHTPTFVTYYHINVHESTSDEGFKDVESLIGAKGALRFQQISKFPIYGIDQIIPEIRDQDIGIDVGYEGEAIILPNTIKPVPNDYFIIPYVKDAYIFRVTEIEFDNIRPDNFYKIHFKLESNDPEKKQDLEDQIHDKYTCIFENVGSENNCIIQQDYYERLQKIDSMYSDMASLYLSLFYNSRYNILLGETDRGYNLYDPYMCRFCNTHKLFQRKGELTSIFLQDNHIYDKRALLKYERSIYRYMERRDVSLTQPFYYTTFLGAAHKESGFAKWEDQSIRVVDLPPTPDKENDCRILSDLSVNTILLNGPTDSIYLKFLATFIRDPKMSIYSIPLTLNDALLRLNANLEMFFITPLLLFAIKTIVENFYKVGLTNEDPKEEIEKEENT